MRERHKARVVRIDDVAIGGDHPACIQPMYSAKTEDAKTTVAQTRALTAAGCEVVRVVVPTMAAVKALAEIRQQIKIPLVADIHLGYRLALVTTERGADRIRISPDNIGEDWKLREAVNAAEERNIPVRVSVNSGSLEKNLLQRYGGVTAGGTMGSALEKVRRIEELDYENLIINIKSSGVLICIRTHELLTIETDYPLHIDITEAGMSLRGAVKSAVGLDVILYGGIGDAIHISLTGDPLEKVKATHEISESLGLRKSGVEIMSCPTHNRTEIDLISLANQVESLVGRYSDPDVRVAIMGCAVDGSGEAQEANLGMAGGKGTGILIRKGEVIRTMLESGLLPVLEAGLQRIRAGRR